MADVASITLRSQADRDKASKWAQGVPVGSRVVFHGPKRSIDQNSAFWSAMGDISRQKEYHGLKLSPEDWRTLFMDALDRESRMVPNLDGNGFVSLGRSSSALGKEDFSDLLSIVYAWCAKEGINLSNGD